MKNIQVKKGERLQNKGDLITKAYRVRSGLLRSYSIDDHGKEHVFMFAPEDWLIADNHGLGQPADLYIDALEDSELTVISEFKEENIEGQKVIKRLYVLQKRIIMLMSSSAIERYEHFVETYPQIVQRVPQKMIASYLGMTPEALSKVKGDRLRK